MVMAMLMITVTLMAMAMATVPTLVARATIATSKEMALADDDCNDVVTVVSKPRRNEVDQRLLHVLVSCGEVLDLWVL